MNTSALKPFAPAQRLQLMEAVTRKLDFVLTADTADLRAMSAQRETLRRESDWDRKGLVERVAYTWFNRFAALRFIDAFCIAWSRSPAPMSSAANRAARSRGAKSDHFSPSNSAPSRTASRRKMPTMSTRPSCITMAAWPRRLEGFARKPNPTRVSASRVIHSQGIHHGWRPRPHTMRRIHDRRAAGPDAGGRFRCSAQSNPGGNGWGGPPAAK